MSSFNPVQQLKATEPASKNKPIDLLSRLRGFKFLTTLVVEFEKIENDDETKYSAFYSNLKPEIIINESDIDNIFESIYITIISNKLKLLGKSSDWVIDSVIDQTSNISKYKP